ncbi:MAG TPA: colicin E5-related ribonuclease [Phycisphaerales bacterium]|nr:colicin E5-related ribonuclease [Phycisphaerales bacterium]
MTDLYYDGVRVVQEVGWAGVPGTVQLDASGQPDTAKPRLPRRANEITYASGEGNASSGCAAQNTVSGWNWSDRRLEKEYIWAADASAYVDECVAQIVYTHAHEAVTGNPAGNDTAPVTLYVLSDHNANVIGLTDVYGRVVAQYAYSPYGELLATEYFTPDMTSLATESRAAARLNRLGHQGLRMERFDRPWEGAVDFTTVDTTSSGGTGSYRALANSRNRMYDPAEGRFISVDPNGLSLPVSSARVFGGMPFPVAAIRHSLADHFADGMNGHVALGSNPQKFVDAAGLEFTLAGLSQNMAMGGFIGGILNGILKGMTPGPGGFWDRFSDGFVKGAIAGAAGGGAAYAFAASASGLFASAMSRDLAVGMFGGSVGGVTNSLLEGNRDWRSVTRDGLWGAFTGGALSVGLGSAGRLIRGQDDVVLLQVSGRPAIPWKFGADKSGTKWTNQMTKRGWTPQQIDEATQLGAAYRATNNLNPSNSATRYVHPTTGRSVVVDDVTYEVFHIGGDNFKYN